MSGTPVVVVCGLSLTENNPFLLHWTGTFG